MHLPEIITMGNMLVEVMRVDTDSPLTDPGIFSGPYPSGDTPIYADSVAKLGGSVGFIGAVGDDDFGKCLLTRFRRDGVDASQVQVLSDNTTGVAFVAYFSDGSRRFLFHWRDSAAGRISPEFVDPAYFARARWLHITGCNLAISDQSREACLKAMHSLPPGARVSFDPNIRSEVLGIVQTRTLCAPVLERSNVLLPSEGEAKLFTGLRSDDEGCRALAMEGKTVVLKRGKAGSVVYSQRSVWEIPGTDMEELDPTGAGDCFCAGFTVATLEGMPPQEAGRFANIVGGLAVTAKGPMEGAPTRRQVDRLMRAKSETSD